MADIVATINTDGGADYTSLSAAEAGERASYADLVSDNNTMEFNCQEGSIDTSAVTIDSAWVTDSTYTLTIKTDQAERHSGTWDEGYRLEVTGGTALTLLTDYSRIIGLSIKVNLTAGTQYVINDYVTTHYTEITHCFLWTTGGDYVTSCIIGRGYPKYGNNICISDSNYDSNQNCVLYTQYINGACYVYNNTIIGGRYSIYGNASLIAKNNIWSGGETQNILGSFSGSSGYNASDDATNTGGTGDRSSVIFDFVDSGNDDFHITLRDTGAKGNGTDLSGDANFPITDDIDGTSRTQWCIGADENVSSLDITWTNIVGCVVDGGNQLRKTAGTAWGNGGATTTKTILSGNDGYIEAQVEKAGAIQGIGLSNDNPDASWDKMDFIILWSGGASNYIIYENGVSKGTYGSYVAGTYPQPLKVAVESGTVKFYINDVLVYTSLTSPTFPLMGDVVLYYNDRLINAYFEDGASSGNPWYYYLQQEAFE